MGRRNGASPYLEIAEVRSGLIPYCSDGLRVGGGAKDGRGMEAGGVLAVAVVATAVEDHGGDAGPGD